MKEEKNNWKKIAKSWQEIARQFCCDAVYWRKKYEDLLKRFLKKVTPKIKREKIR